MPVEDHNAGNRRSTKWMLSSLPANIAFGPLSTLIPLYILQLGGGILDVSYAITLAGAVSIPAVFLWGFVTDFVNKRRMLIVLPYLFTGMLIASLFFVKSISDIILIYAAISFVSAAAAAPMNLLIMEKSLKSMWAHNFSWLQTLISLGSTIGLIVAWVITGVASLDLLIMVLAASSMASSAVAFRLINEPSKVEKKGIPLQNNIYWFLYRLVGVPHAIVRIPNPMHMKDWFRFRGLELGRKRFVMAFYAISFIFFFASSVFNTEYPVGLRIRGLTESAIFFIVLAAMIVQTLTFYFYDRLAKNKRVRIVAYLSLVLRGSSYAIVGAAFILLAGFTFLAGNLLFYMLAAGVAYAVYYPTSYAMLFNTLKRRSKGSAMGLYSALVGIGTFMGSLVSGGLAVAYGFGSAFIIAGLLMFACAVMYRLLPQV